ncbi:hypothetical protein [Bradyrhizobium sp. HKCCYLS20291]|uniref:hypothetical protein n=1 Tax=Bradyrhizobium sp. HKCCYLS20291 TaxID=3420766 RepID=UPI003EBA6355
MPFAGFVAELQHAYGAEAASARHEIFFIAQRTSWLGPRPRALLAAVRDALLCLMANSTSVSAAVVMIASRPGPSGIDALQPFMADLDRRGILYDIAVHPRLRRAVSGASGPGRPPWSAWMHACRAFVLTFEKPDWRAFVVRCCLFRLRLWQGAWSRTLGAQRGGALVLHNDFELFCVAALLAGGTRWHGVCVQHGLPTDEFFPTRAPRQIVWGESSRRAYLDKGTPPAVLRYGPHTQIVTRQDRPLAQAIGLVSQTHTPVFGRALSADFLDIAERIAARFAGRELAIHLHPEEVRLGHPYTSERLAVLCRRPPHAEFGGDTGPSKILVGFCSTALIQAAQNGHLVIGMNWPVTASRQALSVGRPEIVADDADQLCDLVDRLLADPAARADMLERQRSWLARSFAHGDDWLPEIPA